MKCSTINQIVHMNKRQFAFSKINFILLGVSMAIVILGFVLMGGPGSTEEQFNPDIFSPMRIKVAPIVCLAGFVLMVVGILYRGKEENMVEPNQEQEPENPTTL